MKRASSIFILVCLLLLTKISAYSQNISNEGTEFWTVFPTHDPTGPGVLATIKIYITSKVGSNGTVTCGTESHNFTVQSNGVVAVVVSRPAAYIDYGQSNVVIEDKAIHVKVNDGQGKIAVYAHIFAGRRSAASLILPVESLGQKYYSMNFRQNPPGQNFLVLTATEPNTQLLIHHGTNPIAITLEKAGDVYQYMPGSQVDLTGVYVEIDPSSTNNCNKRFAAFSGSTSVTIGSCGSSRDPLFQQLYPTSSWGKNYGIVPFFNRKYIIRVVAQENATRVYFSGRSIFLNKGESYDSGELDDPSFISADKNISVAQYSRSQCDGPAGANLSGDPEMVLLNPIEFNIKAVTLFSSTDQDIRERYINVYMKTSATGSFRINGQQRGFSWRVIPSNPDYSYMQLSIFDVNSTLSADDGFNAIAYGFGQTESYAYSAGTTLAASNYLRIRNLVTNQDSENACIAQSSDFKIFLPARPEKISWILDSEVPVEVDAPQPSNQITDGSGVITYEYTYKFGKAFTELGQHSMVVKVKLPTVASCIGNEYIYNYTFAVEPIPIPDFSYTNLGCEFDGTTFTDLSDSKLPTKQISKWTWDFGDGSDLVYEKNPVHRYATTGSYMVKLSVATADGCTSEIIAKEVKIILIPSPDVVFDPIPDICLNGGLFTITTARETKGVSGTGQYSGPGITPEGVFDPKIAGVGIHEITYTYRGDIITEGNTYCQDVQKQTITVASIPVLDFEKDFYILVDGAKPFNAKASGPQSTYKWTPAIGLDRDDILNPVIKGEEDRVYTLTAITAQGCITIDTITVHVLEGIKVANAFSPNGDGINDVWKIEHIDSYPNVTVQVFNRYGVIVFSSKGYPTPFDGKYQNKDLSVQTYFYIIDPGNGKARKTGPLTIIR